MELTLTTPALLFPAISLLLLAYTNRFLALAALIRDLNGKYKEKHDPIILAQIINLRKRIKIIRNMQIFGVSAFFLCVLSMFSIFRRKLFLGEASFGLSLIFLMTSLALSIYEVQISIKALTLEIDDNILK